MQVLILCFTLCTITYASMAVLGYSLFGSEVPSQITLNLPTGKLSFKVAIYTTLVNPFIKYALMVIPIVDATKSCLHSRFNTRLFVLLISTAFVISTAVVALVVPFFGSMMSLVGTFLSVTASIIFSCSCYMKISGIYQVFGYETGTIGFIIVMGITVFVFGTYTSLLEIIDEF